MSFAVFLDVDGVLNGTVKIYAQISLHPLIK